MKKLSSASREVLNLWLSVAGQGVSGLGHYLFSFAMGLYVLSLTGSAQSYAVTVAISLLPSALLSPIVGTLADRVSKKLLVVTSDALNSLLLLCSFFLALTRPLTVGSIYLITFLMSLLRPFVEVPFLSAGPRLVSDRQLSRLVSYRSAVMSIIQVAAPVLGGAVYAVLDLRMFILFSSIAYALSALSELFIDFDFNTSPDDGQPHESFLATLRGGASYLFSSRLLVAIICFCMALNLIFSAMDALLPFSILEILKLSERSYGIIMAAFSVGNLLGSVYIGRKNLSFSRRLLSVSIALCALFLVCLAVLISAPLAPAAASVLLCLSCMLFGIIVSFPNITASVFLQRLVPGKLLGRVNGLFGMATTLLTPLGMLLFGTLADHFAPSAILMTCAVLIGGLSLIGHRMTSLDEAVASLSS